MKKQKLLSLAIAAAVATGFVQAQEVQYTVPDNAYYRGYYYGGDGVPNGPFELVVPPYCDLKFTPADEEQTDIQWSINYTEGYPSSDPNYGLPTGEATPVESEEDGSYIYHIGAANGGVNGESFYRFPILTHGDESYDLSEQNGKTGGSQNYYTRAGITATNETTVLTLLNWGFNNPDDGFSTIFMGGINTGETYPVAYTNTTSGEASSLTNVCDGDEGSYYATLGPAHEGDFIIVDLGEIAVRNNIRIIFADSEHILQGTATVLCGETSVSNEMTTVGEYSPEKVQDGVFECDVDGVSGRYICFYVNTVTSETPKPYYAEFEEDNMRFFWKPSTETVILYPKATATEPHYGDRDASKLLDDDVSTFYHKQGTQEVGDYVMLECKDVMAMNKIKVAFNSTDVKDDMPLESVLEISQTNDGEDSWTQIGDPIRREDAQANNQYTYTFDAQGAEAKYVRLRITQAAANWFSVADLIIEGLEYETEEVEVESPTPMMGKIITYYPRPQDPFYLDHITMFATTVRNSGSNTIIPAGQSIKVAIIKLERDEEDKVTYGDTIAKATIEPKDLETPYMYASGRDVYAMNVNFYTNPEGIGVPEKTGVLLDSEYAIHVYDLTEVPGLNISFLFNDAHIDRGIYGLMQFTYADSDTENNFGQLNYAWQLTGRYITMRPATNDIIECQPEGGIVELQNADFYSSVDLESIEIDAPDWANIEFGEMTEGDIKTTYTITASANETTEERNGIITLTSPEGATCTINLHQAGGTVGISSFEEKAINVTRSGNNFAVTYPETMNRVTVYNATGMMVADYELPAGGYFVIPASDFNAGMYIVKVAGENTVKTIKIVK